MYQIDDTTAVTPEPALPTDNIGTPGFFTGGVTGSVPATRVRFWWLNMIQNELCNIVLAAGLTLTKALNSAQVLAALEKLYVKTGGMGGFSRVGHAMALIWTGTKTQLWVDASNIGNLMVEPTSGSSTSGSSSYYWRIASDGSVRMWGEYVQPADGSGYNQLHLTFPIPFPNGSAPTGVSVTTANTTSTANGASYSTKTSTGMNISMGAAYTFSWEVWQ